MKKSMNNESLLAMAMELQGIAQTGLHYGHCDYDRLRYERLRELSAQLLAMTTDSDVQTVRDFYWPQSGYPTPRTEVRVGVVKDDRILLVQEEDDECWALPGGWADEWCTPTENARKELREESGLEVASLQLIGLLDSRRCLQQEQTPVHVYTLLFRGDNPEGELQGDHEILNVDWFKRTDLPPLSAKRTCIQDIHLVFSKDNCLLVD